MTMCGRGIDMSEFTKGPWEVSFALATDHLHVKNEEAGREWYHSSRAIFAGDMKIAHVDINISNTVIGYPTPQSHEELLANANLIASAPDLLEALENICQRLEQMQYDHNTCDGDLALEEARAAIAKARGV